MSERGLILAGALLLALGVGAGAFGAHGLRPLVTARELEVWQTAVLYQLVHGLGMLLVAGLLLRWPSRVLRAAGVLMFVGIVLFSGSLYALVLTDSKWLGPITPIGGVTFIVAWLLVAYTALRGR